MPPENKPTSSEINTCRNYLSATIDRFDGAPLAEPDPSEAALPAAASPETVPTAAAVSEPASSTVLRQDDTTERCETES